MVDDHRGAGGGVRGRRLRVGASVASGVVRFSVFGALSVFVESVELVELVDVVDFFGWAGGAGR